MTKLTNQILMFTAGDSDVDRDRREGYENFIEYHNAYQKGESNTAAFKKMNETMLQLFKDEIARMSNKKIEDYTDAVQYFSFPDVSHAAFTVVGMLVDLVTPNAIIKDFDALVEVKHGGWGDTLKVSLEPRDLFAISKSSRARRTADIKRYFRGETTIVAEPRQIAVGLSLYDVLTGKFTLAEFVGRVVESFKVHIGKEIHQVFADAMNALPSSGTKALSINGWSSEGFVQLAQKIQAWNDGAPVTALGTKLALSKVLPESGNTRILVDNTQPLVNLGYLHAYMGIPLLELTQVADLETEFGVALKDNEIFLLSLGKGKPIKMFIEGSTIASNKDAYDHANLQATANLFMSYGLGIVTSSLAGKITLT